MSQLIIACLLLFAAFLLSSCGGGPSQRIKDIEAQKPIPTPTPGEREISGVFNVTGASTNDIDPYSGSLRVAPKGDNYEFRWTTTKGTRVGTGVQMGSSTAVSVAATGGGKGCGVVVYKIGSDGTLDGKRADWGYDLLWTEKAVRVEGTSFVGKYEVSGTYGRPYKGTLIITKDGAGYDFDWKLKNDEEITDNHVGFGTWRGSYAAASFGGYQCGFALYDIKSNGNMEGNWGGQKSVIFGTESAKRQ